MMSIYTPEVLRAARGAVEAIHAWPEAAADVVLDLIEQRVPGLDRESVRPDVVRRLRAEQLEIELAAEDALHRIEQAAATR